MGLELLVTLVVALLVLGPKQLLNLAQGLGRLLRYFNQLRMEFMQSFDRYSKQETLKTNIIKAEKIENPQGKIDAI